MPSIVSSRCQTRDEPASAFTVLDVARNCRHAGFYDGSGDNAEEQAETPSSLPHPTPDKL